jgi:hypothetical protein
LRFLCVTRQSAIVTTPSVTVVEKRRSDAMAGPRTTAPLRL